MTSVAPELLGLRQDVPLAPLTSLKVGGAADLFVSVYRPAEAAAVLTWVAAEHLPLRWIGGGSNLLVADGGLAGVAARYLGNDVRLPTENGTEVVAEAGRSFPNLARTLARAGWSGLEWAANVPGTVGGAVVNNAGAFGSCTEESLAWAEIVAHSGRVECLAPSQLGFAYRSSRLKRGELSGIVVRAAFRVRRAPSADVIARVHELQRQRTASQPRQLSAGSVFANPSGDFAGRLIEASGLKGHRIGRAQISVKHANFIVNLGGATATDVYDLARQAQIEVWRQHAVWLLPEIELIGHWSEADRSKLAKPPRGEADG